MTPTARILRGASAAILALGLAGVTGLVGVPAHAAALPKPRSEEWWFTAWDIRNQVWQQTQGQGVTVAVVDTGVNAQLPELRGVVLPGGDARHGGTADGLTDIDTTHGGHGTGMAGLIAGQGGPSGMVGIAPGAKILPVVINGLVGTLAQGITYAADHGAKVINLSQGTPYPGGCPGIAQAAVSHAIDKGAVVVASAGNSGNTTNDAFVPGSCAGVLTVGAIADNRLAWTRTERQPYVSVAAPGVGVGVLLKNGTFNNNSSGTSQASALASGAVALIRSKFPQLSPRQVVQKIINTTVDAGPAGHDNMTGAGAMVPIFALTRDVPSNAPNPTFQRLDAWRAQNPNLQGGTPSGPAKKSGSGSGMAVTLGIVAGVVGVAVVVIGILLMRRRRPQPAGPQPYPGGQGPYQQQAPPPPFQPPADRRQGRPSFRPPSDPGPPPG